MDLLVHKCVALHDLCPVSHRVQFKPYGREEIVRIVEARVSDLNVFEEKCIEMVAARVANACAGDMRKALHALVEVCNAGESLLLRTRTTQQQQQQHQQQQQLLQQQLQQQQMYLNLMSGAGGSGPGAGAGSEGWGP